jgi:hypothetical protein
MCTHTEQTGAIHIEIQSVSTNFLCFIGFFYVVWEYWWKYELMVFTRKSITAAYFFLSVTEIWTEGLCLPSRQSYTCATSPVLYCSKGYFSDRVSLILFTQGWNWTAVLLRRSPEYWDYRWSHHAWLVC